MKRGRSHRRRRLATSFGPHVDHPSGHGHGGLSDARVKREGPTIADVYIDISPFYGMAPATVSGYRSGGRRYAYTKVVERVQLALRGGCISNLGHPP